MPLLYRILGFVAFFLLVAFTVTFAFGFFLVLAVVSGLVGLYRYYLVKKGRRKSKVSSKSRGYSSGEIIDMPVEDKNK